MSRPVSVSKVVEKLPETVQTDEVYAALSKSRRRVALLCLDRNDEPIAIADLARDVAREETPQGENRELAAVERIKLSLYHADLPKMAETGLVAVDRDRQTARLRRTGEALAAELRTIEDR